MTKRILLAGVLGAIAMFAWSAVAHMFTSLGNIGVKEIPNEPAALEALHKSIGDSHGLYYYPGMGLGDNPSPSEQRAAMPQQEKKLATNPSGILIYHPPGRSFAMGGMLLTEFLTELSLSLLVAFLLAQTRLASYAARVGFVVAAGLLAAIATNVSYWNWYGFPGSYTLAYMCIQIVGFLVSGLVVAAVVKTGAGRTVAAAA